MRKFFVDKEKIKENFAYIEGKDTHHIINVLRLKKGDEIVISDGSTEYQTSIYGVEKTE